MTTIEEQIACVRREIRLREALYPKRVKDNRMSLELARREIKTMRDVYETLVKIADKSTMFN